MKRVFQIQKKLASNSQWSAISQCYCEPCDVRSLIHSVAFDNSTRIVAVQQVADTIPVYNFCPPGVMTKLND